MEQHYFQVNEHCFFFLFNIILYVRTSLVSYYFHSKVYSFVHQGLKQANFYKVKLRCMNLTIVQEYFFIVKSYIPAHICFQISSYLFPGLLESALQGHISWSACRHQITTILILEHLLDADVYASYTFLLSVVPCLYFLFFILYRKEFVYCFYNFIYFWLFGIFILFWYFFPHFFICESH
jgi:hypothetical protein